MDRGSACYLIIYWRLLRLYINAVPMTTKSQHIDRCHFVIFPITLCISAASLCISSLVQAKQKNVNPIEVGDVNWSRDYAGALEDSKINGKPLFILFQEVPGCLGCRNFGQNVLTHTLLVEAIEDEFIPVLVFNNKMTGMDGQMLKYFDEPSWNFQVIRFIDANQKDVIPRRDRVWDIGGVALQMIKALEAVDRPVPRYLKAVALEHDTSNLKMAAFAMACFWTGENKLGKIDGVIQTEAGWFDGREVTLVTYHTRRIDLAKLVGHAQKEECAQSVYVETKSEDLEISFPMKQFDSTQYRIASEGDQKKQIQRWRHDHKNLYLSPMQMTKLNALMIKNRSEALSWLSPRQLKKIKY